MMAKQKDEAVRPPEETLVAAETTPTEEITPAEETPVAVNITAHICAADFMPKEK